jgi:hypothetical protein
MPTSPLGAAILGGNEPALGYMDPTLLQAMPDVQLGQSMQQGALSTAGAYPAQAWARLAQAISGSYIQHQALSDLGKAYANTPTEMAKILEKTQPGNPVIPMLKSEDAPTRMLGMQLLNKTVPLQAETHEVNPTQTMMTGGGKPVGQGAPENDMTVMSRAETQARASGNTELADAIAQEASSKTYNEKGVPRPAVPLNPPQGVSNNASGLPLNMPRTSGLPLNPPRVAAPQLPSVPKSAVRPPSPTAAVHPPSPGNAAPTTTDRQTLNETDQANAPALAQAKQSYADQIIAQQAKQTEADEKAKAGVEYGDLLKPTVVGQGPGQTEPLTTARGTTIPALTDQAPVPTNPAQLKTKVPEWQKTASQWTDALKSGQLAEQRLNTIAGAFKAIQTGSFTTDRADWAAKIRALGMNGLADRIMAHPEQAQLGLHENYAETMEQLKANTARFTQQEFKITSENKQHPNLQPEANLQMLAEDLGPIRQTRDLATDWTAAQRQGWRDPQSFESAWLRQNKLSDYVKRAKDEIGPLKGMPGNAAPGSANGGWGVRVIAPPS